MQTERRGPNPITPAQIGIPILFGLVVFGLVKFSERVPPMPEWETVRRPAELATAPYREAANALDALQPSSFAQNQEYCGYLYNDGGAIKASPPIEGDLDSCAPEFTLSALPNMIATYHTHGGYSPEYFNETPSVRDMRLTLDSGIDDYVATPGGRLWHLSAEHEAAMLVCATGCLQVDPQYQPCPAEEAPISFRLSELRERDGKDEAGC